MNSLRARLDEALWSLEDAIRGVLVQELLPPDPDSKGLEVHLEGSRQKPDLPPADPIPFATAPIPCLDGWVATLVDLTDPVGDSGGSPTEGDA